jgi:phosphoglycerate kinase
MIAEITALSKALEAPERPVLAVVGGAKISSKLDVLGNVVSKVNHLIIGGAMANTFLFAEGVAVGKSLCERELKGTALEIMAKAREAGCHIHLPKDVVVADELKEGTATRTIPVTEVGESEMILDVGPRELDVLCRVMDDCRTLLWNGPLGAFEFKPFDMGTNGLAQRAAELTEAGKLLSVAGGGDTVAALNNAGVAGKFSHVSTAGGAFLEWLEGKSLPGVKVLEA